MNSTDNNDFKARERGFDRDKRESIIAAFWGTVCPVTTLLAARLTHIRVTSFFTSHEAARPGNAVVTALAFVFVFLAFNASAFEAFIRAANFAGGRVCVYGWP